MPNKVRQAGAPEESALLSDFPDWTIKFKNDELAATWVDLLKVRSVRMEGTQTIDHRKTAVRADLEPPSRREMRRARGAVGEQGVGAE